MNFDIEKELEEAGAITDPDTDADAGASKDLSGADAGASKAPSASDVGASKDPSAASAPADAGLSSAAAETTAVFRTTERTERTERKERAATVSHEDFVIERTEIFETDEAPDLSITRTEFSETGTWTEISTGGTTITESTETVELSMESANIPLPVGGEDTGETPAEAAEEETAPEGVPAEAPEEETAAEGVPAEAAEEETVPEDVPADISASRPGKVKVVGVRFRTAGKIYYFAPGDFDLSRGKHVIVETACGIEYGFVVGPPMEVPKRSIQQPLRPVLRISTEEDDRHVAKNRESEREAFHICRERIRRRGLEMKLIDAEYTFDNSKLLFYFTADGRVDFRELVKDLASVFRTRIELRQVGVRDETKILGGYGSCGRPLCCHTWLSDFVPVSIKMAKEQNLSLNPGKISGVCGRLMCCLKNEADTYEELNRAMPHPGDEVEAGDGMNGLVESVNILRQTARIIVEVDDEKELREYEVSDLTILRRRKRGASRPSLRREQAQKNAAKETGAERRGSRSTSIDRRNDKNDRYGASEASVPDEGRRRERRQNHGADQIPDRSSEKGFDHRSDRNQEQRYDHAFEDGQGHNAERSAERSYGRSSEKSHERRSARNGSPDKNAPADRRPYENTGSRGSREGREHRDGNRENRENSRSRNRQYYAEAGDRRESYGGSDSGKREYGKGRRDRRHDRRKNRSGQTGERASVPEE